MSFNDVFIKVEANVKTGGGHLHRSLVLAEELRKFNVNVKFIVSHESEDLAVKKVKDFEVYIIKEIYDFKEYLDIITPSSLIIFDTDDNKFYSGNLIDTLRRNSIKTACFTVSDEFFYSTDFVINTNIIALSQKYKTEDYTIKLLGPHYMIFKPQFKNVEFNKAKINNLLLYFGNADKYNLTEKMLLYLESTPGKFDKINVITGSLNKNIHKIENIVRRNNDMSFYRDLTTDQMIDIYQNTFITIGSAGMAMWEMALWRIPQIIIASSEREKEYTDYLNKLGYIYKLSDYTNIDNSDVTRELDNILKSNIIKKLKTEKFRNIINVNGVTNIVNDILKYQ